jgi:hypothetical protein
MHIKYYFENLSRKDHLGCWGVNEKMNIEMDFKETECEGVDWIHPLRVGASEVLLRNRQGDHYDTFSVSTLLHKSILFLVLQTNLTLGHIYCKPLLTVLMAAVELFECSKTFNVVEQNTYSYIPI